MRQSIKRGYVQSDLLGTGAFSQVYKVTLDQTNYALKRIYNNSLKDLNYSECVFREINIMKQLNHRGIVKLYDVFHGQNQLQLLLEYVSEGTLFQKMKNEDRLSEPVVKKYIKDIIEVLKYLHSFQQPILHRDIKPENIILDKDGRVKLCDFGSANVIIDDIKRHSFVGTDEYMAPEMKQSLAHDESLDIWCVGILIYELLVGKTPNLQNLSFPHYISRPAQDLINRILVRQPNKRMKLHEIQEHIWFVQEEFETKFKNRYSLKLQTKQSKQQKLDLISQRNRQINNKYNMSLLTTERSLNRSSLRKESQLNRQIDEKLEPYMQQLKEKSSLISQIQKNNKIIEELQKEGKQKRQIEDEEIKGINEQIKQFKNNIGILRKKQPKVHILVETKIKQLLQTLNYLQQFVNEIPERTKNQILNFNSLQQQDDQIEQLPMSQYIPKLKNQILKMRRDSLIEFRSVLKRKRNMSQLLFLQNRNEENFSVQADASCHSLLQ